MAASTKEQIRRDFPQCAAMVDEFRAVFGPQVRVLWMSEGGRELGTAPKDEGVSLAQMVIAPAPAAPPPPPRPQRVRWRDRG